MDVKTHISEFGSIQKYLSSVKRTAYRRINLEYLWILKQSCPQEIETVIWDGILANLKIQSHTFGLAEHFSQPAKSLTSLEHLKLLQRQLSKALNEAPWDVAIPSGVSGNGRYHSSGRRARAKEVAVAEAFPGEEKSAASLLTETLQSEQQRGKRLLKTAFKQLHRTVAEGRAGYRAHFDYAWLCAFFFHNSPKAEEHFEEAAVQAFEVDMPFAVFALRHLAETRRDLQKYYGAVEAAKEAFMLDKDHTPAIRFDLARYLTLAEQDEKVIDYLEPLLADHPEYYWECQADPDLAGNDRLEILIKRVSEERWSNWNIDLLDLPDEEQYKSSVFLTNRVKVKQTSIPTPQDDEPASPEELLVFDESDDLAADESPEEQLVPDEGDESLEELPVFDEANESPPQGLPIDDPQPPGVAALPAEPAAPEEDITAPHDEPSAAEEAEERTGTGAASEEPPDENDRFSFFEQEYVDVFSEEEEDEYEEGFIEGDFITELPTRDSKPRRSGNSLDPQSGDGKQQAVDEIRYEMDLALERCEMLDSFLANKDKQRTQEKIMRDAEDAIARIADLDAGAVASFVEETKEDLQRQVSDFFNRHKFLTRIKGIVTV